MKTKEEVIKEAYVKLIGEERFNEFKDWIDNDGWVHLEYLPKDTNLSDFKLKTYTEYHNDFRTTICQPKLLKGIDNNFGWISIQSENWLKDHKINGSTTKFYVDNPDEDYLTIEILVSDGKNQEQLTLSDYLFIKDEMLQKGIKATHYAPIEKRLSPLYK